MTDQPWDVLAAARKGGMEAQKLYPGDGDKAKAHRSIWAYEAFRELSQHYKRVDALLMLDPNKNGGAKQATMFGVSERHIRRIETIRRERPKQWPRLEEIAKQGTVSLETIEHLCLHPSTDLVEVVWLVLDKGSP
jgi:hypothetical protein